MSLGETLWSSRRNVEDVSQGTSLESFENPLLTQSKERNTDTEWLQISSGHMMGWEESAYEIASKIGNFIRTYSKGVPA